MGRRKEKSEVGDVRNADEYEKNNVEGLLIALSTLASNLDKIRKDVPVILNCQGGTRSKKATALLMQQGFTNVRSLTGGMRAILLSSHHPLP